VATAGMFRQYAGRHAHSFKNESDKPARMLISVAPPVWSRCSSRLAFRFLLAQRPLRHPRRQRSRSCCRCSPYGIEIRLPVTTDIPFRVHLLAMFRLKHCKYKTVATEPVAMVT